MTLFDSFRAKKEIKPEEYGWSKKFNYGYQKNGYTLYKGGNGWVLDKFPKDSPGVICRFGETLTDIDIEEANNFAEHISSPTRRLSRSI